MAVIAVLAGLAAATAGCRPAGWPPADVVLTGVVAAGVTWASARARPWTTMFLAGAALLTAGGWWLAVSAAGLAAGALALRARRPEGAALLGAAAGALGVNALARIGELSASWRWHAAPTGAASVVAALACAPVLVSAWTASSPLLRRRLRRALLGVLAFAVLATAGFAVAAVIGRRDMAAGISAAQRGLDAAERGNQPGAAAQLRISADAFERAHQEFDAPWAWPARLLPVLGHYAQAAGELARAGYTVAGPSAEAAQQVPYERITAHPGEVDLALLRRIVGPVARADAAVDAAAKIVDRLDTSWLLPPLTSRIDRYRTHLDGAVPEADRSLEAVRLAPALLGVDGPRQYLVLFANPAESRQLGGYSGAYGVLSADHGRVSLSRSGRTEDLPASPSTASAANALGWPMPLYDPALHLGNVTASDDFPAMARAAAQLFGGPLHQHVDGVLYVDPKGLAALLGIVGSIHVDGLDEWLSELNLAQFLLRDQYADFRVRSERFDFLSTTARETFHLLTTRSLPSPVKMFEQLDPAVAQNHLMLWFADPATRNLLDAVGVSGRTRLQPGTAVFDLRTSNLSQNKTDAFLHRSVDYEATIDHRDGTIDAEVTLTLENTAPLDLSNYVLSNRWRRSRAPDAPPLGSDTLLVSVASSLGLRSATIDGDRVSLGEQASTAEPDGSANRYTTTVTVPAGGSVTLVLRLHGHPASIPRSITFVHQPLANDDRVRVVLRGDHSTRELGPFTLSDTRVVALARA